MKITETNIKTVLGISRANYEDVVWGSSNPKWQIQASQAQRFSQDEDKTFDNVAYNAFTVLANILPVLLRFPKAAWIPDADKEEVRVAVFKIMQYWADNNLIRYNTNTSNISTPNFTITNESNEVLLIGELIGLPTWAYVQKMGLWKTYVFQTEEEYQAFVATSSGNFEIIGKFDLDKVKELI